MFLNCVSEFHNKANISLECSSTVCLSFTTRPIFHQNAPQLCVGASQQGQYFTRMLLNCVSEFHNKANISPDLMLLNFFLSFTTRPIFHQNAPQLCVWASQQGQYFTRSSSTVCLSFTTRPIFHQNVPQLCVWVSQQGQYFTRMLLNCVSEFHNKANISPECSSTVCLSFTTRPIFHQNAPQLCVWVSQQGQYFTRMLLNCVSELHNKANISPDLMLLNCFHSFTTRPIFHQNAPQLCVWASQQGQYFTRMLLNCVSEFHNKATISPECYSTVCLSFTTRPIFHQNAPQLCVWASQQGQYFTSNAPQLCVWVSQRGQYFTRMLLNCVSEFHNKANISPECSSTVCLSFTTTCCEAQTHSWGAFWWNIGLVVKLRHTVEEHSGEILALLWNSDTQLRSILVKYWPCCETQTHSWGAFWWNIGLVVKLRHTVEEHSGEILALLWNSDTQLRSILVKYWPCCETQTHSWGAFWWNIGLVVKLRHTVEEHSGEILALLWNSDTQLRSILVKYWPCCETQTHSWGAFWWNIGLVVKLRHTVEEHSGEILALLWNSDTQLRSILVKYWPCCETQTHSWGAFWWNIGLVVKLRHTVEEHSGEILALLWNSDTQLRSILVKYWPCCKTQTHSWGAFWWNIGLVVKLRHTVEEHSGEILALLWSSDTQLKSILVKYWPCCETQTHSWGAFWWNIGLVVKLRHTVEEHYWWNIGLAVKLRHTVEEHSGEILASLWNSDTQLSSILVK